MSAIRGKRGQAFLRRLAEAMDAMPEKRLIASALRTGSDRCALGLLASEPLSASEGVDEFYGDWDKNFLAKLSKELDISRSLVREIAFQNDECTVEINETPEARWVRMRTWVRSRINKEAEH